MSVLAYQDSHCYLESLFFISGVRKGMEFALTDNNLEVYLFMHLFVDTISDCVHLCHLGKVVQ